MTAMQQLLNQMREERSKLPLPIEWDRCYQAIEMMIQNTYIPLEKEQIIEAAERWKGTDFAEKYYNEQYGGNNYDVWDEVIYQLGDTNKMIELPQQEISDEEIEQKALEVGYTKTLFIDGAKWYREKLKSKGNG
jgi:hypothetical protein